MTTVNRDDSSTSSSIDATQFYLSSPWSKYWGNTPEVSEDELARTILEYFDADDNQLRVKYRGTVLNRNELSRQAKSLAFGLAEGGLVRGDRIAIMLQNQPEFLVSIIAAWRLGLIVIPVNPMYRQVELGHILNDSGARAVIVLNDLVQHIEQVQENSKLELVIGVAGPVNAPVTKLQFSDLVTTQSEIRFEYPKPQDPAFLCYTSGTTGPAKGALLTHRNVVMGTLLFQRIQELNSKDVNFAIAPLFHVTGLIGAITVACAVGLTLVLDYRFEAARVISIFRDEGVTFTAGPTTVFRALLQHEDFTPEVFATANKIICGGAPIPKTFADEFKHITGQRLHSGYGMTETSAPCFGTPRAFESPVQEGLGLLALGIPAPGTECRLLDDDGNDVPIGTPGELTIRGPQVMSEYWQQPEETAKVLHDCWLRTGDVAIVDEDGWFFMVDRKKNQINASGFKVWPNEVEDVLRLHVAVSEVAVVGVPDEYRGETVKAVIALKPGVTVTESELRDHSRAHLAAYKCPTIFVFVEELPKSEAGKVVKQRLVEL